MDARRLTGPLAGGLKYDLLTALSVAGLHGPPIFQVTMMRLIALVTARYNWRMDELSVGQRDMAKMWGVNERTVKREVKRLTEARIIICTRKGVRGRVAAYRLNFEEIYARSLPQWSAVGPDFVERMSQRYQSAETKVVKVDFGSPEIPEAQQPQNETDGPREWRHVMRNLRQNHPQHAENWFSKLEMNRWEAGQLELRAPSKFFARYIKSHLSGILIFAASEELGPVDELVIVSAE